MASRNLEEKIEYGEKSYADRIRSGELALQFGNNRHACHVFGFAGKVKAYMASWDPENMQKHISEMEEALKRSEESLDALSEERRPHVEYHNNVTRVHGYLLVGDFEKTKKALERVGELSIGKSRQHRSLSEFVDSISSGNQKQAVTILNTYSGAFYYPAAQAIVRGIGRTASVD